MFPLDLLLAAVLITTPEIACEEPPCSLAAMQAVVLSWELMDPRETRYVFRRPVDFGADLKLLRRRYTELRDVPSLADAIRFPARETLNECLTFNRQYRQWLVENAPLADDENHAAIKECDAAYVVYDAARDAQMDYYYVTVRRLALQKLRDRIGPHLYYAGCLPPHVPVWRFRRIE